MKIALYESMHGWTTVWEVNDHREDDKDYVRVSEILDVEFVSLPKKEVVPKQVAALEEAKAEARAKFQVAINMIDEKIAKLLAIEDHSNGN